MNLQTNPQLPNSVLDLIVSQQQVWGLKGKEGWAVAQSNLYDSAEVYVFWSSQDEASKAAQEEWSSYTAAPIPLDEFLEDWCVAIYYENSLIGFNWDFTLCGAEVEPMHIAKSIIDAIKKHNMLINFAKSPNLKALSDFVDSCIQDEQELS